MICVKYLNDGEVLDGCGIEAKAGYAIVEYTDFDDGTQCADLWAYGYETRKEAQKELDAIKEEWGIE